MTSLINFLNPKLKPNVETDAICEDGYEVTNLISDDLGKMNRGFMSFNVTKPPVDILFEFPKAIDMKVIKIWNTLGSLRSTAFEVHGKTSGGIYERVGFVRDLPKSTDSVTFCYQSEYSSRNSSQCEKVFFFKSAGKILANTTSIKIIIRSTHKCAPVIKRIQIWGLPARSLEKADRELMKTIWNEITNPNGDLNPPSAQRSPNRSNIPELNYKSKLTIPEEFLDAITWDLMIFPTVLPSGKTVDQSTIDKHSEVESKWGRLPSDPFTGLQFTSQRKAILDLALKARIEKFLMENSEHFKTVPRTLGSSRVRRSKNRHASSFASMYGHTVSSTISSTTSMSSAVPAKRARLHAPDYCSEMILQGALGKSTINNDIQQALQNITRYTRPPAEIKRTTCIGCKSEDYTYEIQTCKHLVCRQCLVQLTKDQMCTCKTSFRRGDVERYHKFEEF